MQPGFVRVEACQRSEDKNSVTNPEMIKNYSSGLGGVDLPDQKTAGYRSDCKSSGRRCYLWLIFDLMDVCMVK